MEQKTRLVPCCKAPYPPHNIQDPCYCYCYSSPRRKAWPTYDTTIHAGVYMLEVVNVRAKCGRDISTGVAVGGFGGQLKSRIAPDTTTSPASAHLLPCLPRYFRPPDSCPIRVMLHYAPCNIAISCLCGCASSTLAYPKVERSQRLMQGVGQPKCNSMSSRERFWGSMGAQSGVQNTAPEMVTDQSEKI